MSLSPPSGAPCLPHARAPHLHHWMHRMPLERLPDPVLSRNLHASSFTFQLTPATPTPLFPTAPIVPARQPSAGMMGAGGQVQSPGRTCTHMQTPICMHCMDP